MPETLKPFPWPIKNIYGIGRNYGAHAKELGNAVPSEPIVFMKPTTALRVEPPVLFLPEKLGQEEVGRIDHEVEIVVAIGKLITSSTEDVASAIAGYAVGIDVTARKLQAKAKKEGLPWTLCKGFQGFAPITRFVVASEFKNTSIRFGLEKNGKNIQAGNTKDMIFSLIDILKYLADFSTLQPGDIVFTGTPEGVGPMLPGETYRMWLEDLLEHRFEIQTV